VVERKRDRKGHRGERRRRKRGAKITLLHLGWKKERRGELRKKKKTTKPQKIPHNRKKSPGVSSRPNRSRERGLLFWKK